MAKRYPQHKIDEALLAYYTLGTYEKAGEATNVPWQTVADWVTIRHVDRYDELVAEHGPKLERRVVAKLGRTVDRATQRVNEALDATGTAIQDSKAEPPNRADYTQGEDGDAEFALAWKAWAHAKSNASKDANAFSGAAKNAALVLGIANDHKLKLEGRPFLISENRDAEDYIRSLVELGVIESTAVEIPNDAAQLAAPEKDPVASAVRSQPEPNARETDLSHP